jgi:peptide/nickel transport system substrate-binding protein
MTVTGNNRTRGNQVLRQRSKATRWTIATAAVVGAALVVAACGGGKSSDGGSGSGSETGKPVSGGDLVYGLEAENNGGWCLPEGQLAISGIQVARAVYDTLMAPNADGKYVPYLAESVTNDAGYSNWTIKLRPGIKFSDGSPLTATVVKNNLDAYRGQYPARKPLLFIFTLQNIKDVTVADDLTVNVSTVTPWPSFPAFLHSSGRLGILGQAQLDDPATCDRNLIGTGPFKLKEWKPDDRLTVTKNASYWRKDKDGNQLPYLDSITFKPYPDAQARLNALQSGELTAGHYSGAEQIDSLRSAKESGTLQELESEKYTELSYGMLNATDLAEAIRRLREGLRAPRSGPL